MPLTIAEKEQLADDFRTAVTSINDMATTMANNDMVAQVDAQAGGGVFNFYFGQHEYPTALVVNSVGGCEEF